MRRREFITPVGAPQLGRSWCTPSRLTEILLPFPEDDQEYQKYVRALREKLAGVDS